MEDEIAKILRDNVSVIALTGFKGSGKDTIGDYLVKYHNYIRLAFGDPIKDACRSIFSFNEKQLHGFKEKEIVDEYWGHTPRELFQMIGTELFRMRLPELCQNMTDNIWVKSLIKKMYEMYIKNPQKNKKFVITDVRFPNELNAMKDLAGTTIRVSRNIETNEIKQFTSHASEILISTFKVDYEIDNSFELSQLHNDVEQIINRVDTIN